MINRECLFFLASLLFANLQLEGQLCQGPLSVTVIGSKSNLPIYIDEATSNVYCTESDEGEITLTVYGGSPAYRCQWSHNSSITNDVATDLSPGSYHVTVTDANGCTSEKTVEVLFMDPLLDELTLVDQRACGECYLADGRQSYFYFEDEYIAAIIDLETSMDLGSTQVCADFDPTPVSEYGDPKLERCWTVLSDSIERSDYRLFFSGAEFKKLATATGYTDVDALIQSNGLYVHIFPLDLDAADPFGRIVDYGSFTITSFDEEAEVWSLELFGVENAKIELLTHKTALPVDLLSFDGKASHGVNHLHWSTANEVNTSRFWVERSREGVRFEDLGFVKAGQGEYAYDDFDPIIGDNYYRLRIEDEDGSVTYSHIVRLRQAGEFSFQIVNNPFADMLYLEVIAARAMRANISIVAITGQVVHSQDFTIERDLTTLQLSLGELYSGNYILRLHDLDSKDIVSRKIIKI